MKTLFGVTKVNRKVRKATGLSALNRYSAPRVKQRVKTKAGLNTPVGRTVRQASRGNLPTLFGLFKSKKSK